MRLLACERGYEGSRATRDIDVVLNIRARRRLIGEFVHALKSTGFVIDGYNVSGQNHRWVRGLAQIDVLVPSGQSEKTLSYDFSGLGKVLMTRGAQFGHRPHIVSCCGMRGSHVPGESSRCSGGTLRKMLSPFE